MLTFPNVTPAVFALVLDQLRAEGVIVASIGDDCHAIKGNGIDATVAYSQDSIVDVTIKHKPWYVPESVIAGKIRDAITLAQQAVAKAGQGGETA